MLIGGEIILRTRGLHNLTAMLDGFRDRVIRTTITPVVPPNTPNGDQPITATYNGSTTQPETLITIRH